MPGALPVTLLHKLPIAPNPARRPEAVAKILQPNSGIPSHTVVVVDLSERTTQFWLQKVTDHFLKDPTVVEVSEPAGRPSSPAVQLFSCGRSCDATGTHVLFGQAKRHAQSQDHAIFPAVRTALQSVDLRSAAMTGSVILGCSDAAQITYLEYSKISKLSRNLK